MTTFITKFKEDLKMRSNTFMQFTVSKVETDSAKDEQSQHNRCLLSEK